MALATVMEVTNTGTRVNHRLSVAAPGQEPYEVTVKRVVPMLLVARLRSGLPLPVRVDPGDRERVVIDWAALSNGASDTEGAATASASPSWGSASPPPGNGTPRMPGSGTPRVPGLPRVTRVPTSREDLKAQIRAVGMPGTAALHAVIPVDPVDDRRLFRMDLVVRLDNGASYVEQDEPCRSMRNT